MTRHARRFGPSVLLLGVASACSGGFVTDVPLVGPSDAGDVPSSPSATVAVEAGTDANVPSDAGSEGDASDAQAQAPTPRVCLDTMYTCVSECRVTYNRCKADCPNDANLQSCLATCKGTLASCQVPCQSNCVACANANQSATGSKDCGALVYVP
jgi:hypothetical protein